MLSDGEQERYAFWGTCIGGPMDRKLLMHTSPRYRVPILDNMPLAPTDFEQSANVTFRVGAYEWEERRSPDDSSVYRNAWIWRGME